MSIIKKCINYVIYHVALAERKAKYGALKEKYGFDEWHMTPKWCKPYINDVVQFIASTMDNSSEGYIVDIGCGLCDILGDKRLKGHNRMGYDLSEAVCKANAELYSDFTVKQGSFDKVIDLKIDYLLALNFTHGISVEDMKAYWDKVTATNDVDRIIVDEVTGNYTYAHDFSDMIEGYETEKVLTGYSSDGGTRQIRILRRK